MSGEHFSLVFSASMNYLHFVTDAGMLMDLLSPLFPSSLIVIMCLGSLSRSFSKFLTFRSQNS